MSRQIDEPSFGDLPEDLAALPASDPKVKKFFADQAKGHLQTQSDQYEARLADVQKPPATQPATKPSNADWFQDPNAAVQRIAPTREEFNNMTAMMQRTAIQNAQMRAERNFQKDWKKFEPKVMKIINALDPAAQADPYNWDTAYYAVKGMETDRIVEEEVNRRTTQQSAETDTARDVPPPPKQPMTAEQKAILTGLGITEEKYRDGQAKVEGRLWPTIK